jgi:MFS family permease
LLRRRLPARVDAGKTTLFAAYLRWIWWRAVLHRGWWLVTSVYLVVDAGLSASQLVVIGVAQAFVGLAFEVPAGVFADTISRKWSLIVSHALMGTAMLATGLVTDFGALVATQMLWGLSWTFATGADVAWITDELDEPRPISLVLVRAGRAQLTGSAVGIAAFGVLGSVVGRTTAIVLAGTAMLALGLYVVLHFSEARFVPTRSRRWAASWSILRRGVTLVRRSRVILVLLATTFLLSGAGTANRLRELRLIELGLPVDPVVWMTVLAMLTLLAGAAALRAAEGSVDRSPRRAYAAACVAGVAGLAVLAVAPEEVSASAAVLLYVGIAVPLTRTIGTVWANQQTTSDVRATVHSVLAQAEYVGVIVLGLAVAGIGGLVGLSGALIACAALYALAILVVQGGARRHS